MLQSLLPAVRHVRTPLVVGALWMLLLWVWLGSGRLIPDDEAALLPRRVFEASELLGSGITLAALSLVAVLLGSLLTIHRWPGGLQLIAFSGAEAHPTSYVLQALDWAGDEFHDIEGSRLTWEDVICGKYLGTAFTECMNAWRIQHELLRRVEGNRHQYWRPGDAEQHWVWEGVCNTLAVLCMTRERRLLGDLLRDASEGLFEAYDRLQAEAELRYSITPPLALLALSSIFLWHWSFAFLALLLIPVVLSARQSEIQSIDTLGRALRTGLIESKIGARLRKRLNELAKGDALFEATEEQRAEFLKETSTGYFSGLRVRQGLRTTTIVFGPDVTPDEYPDEFAERVSEVVIDTVESAIGGWRLPGTRRAKTDQEPGELPAEPEA